MELESTDLKLLDKEATVRFLDKLAKNETDSYRFSYPALRHVGGMAAGLAMLSSSHTSVGGVQRLPRSIEDTVYIYIYILCIYIYYMYIIYIYILYVYYIYIYAIILYNIHI